MTDVCLLSKEKGSKVKDLLSEKGVTSITKVCSVCFGSFGGGGIVFHHLDNFPLFPDRLFP